MEGGNRHSLSKHRHKHHFPNKVSIQLAPCFNTPQLLDVDLKEVHPLIRNLLDSKIKQAPLAGRLRFYLKNWEKLTQDPNILAIVQGYNIPFSEEPFQEVLPTTPRVNQEERILIESEVQEMLKKGAIQQVQSVKGEYLSNLFLVSKKDGGNRPVVNLKHLNKFIPYQHFKMEGIHLLKDLLQEEDYMIKIDLNDAYFGVPLHKQARKYVRFRWEGNLFEFLCLCFGLGPAPRIFTKLLKIPIALMRRINIRIIIFLDDMLLMSQKLSELLQARETLIFVLKPVFV